MRKAVANKEQRQINDVPEDTGGPYKLDPNSYGVKSNRVEEKKGEGVEMRE